MIDAVASSNNVSIKRVTDKPRNPVNQANEMELDYITISKEVLAKGRKVEPKVQEFDEKVLCFYPIMTNQMCMQCHGNPVTDIQSETLTKIDELYPNDMARGYSSDQLRGVWVVEMDKK